MIVCPKCGFTNKKGVLFCEDCGQNISNESLGSISTRKIESLDDDPTLVKGSQVTEETIVSIVVTNAPSPIEVKLSDTMIIGRSDPLTPTTPEIDLAPYGALELGVSRRHAKIEFNSSQLALIDIGSSNGTFVNGVHLPENMPRILAEGDELRFGKLVARIYFK